MCAKSSFSFDLNDVSFDLRETFRDVAKERAGTLQRATCDLSCFAFATIDRDASEMIGRGAGKMRNGYALCDSLSLSGQDDGILFQRIGRFFFEYQRCIQLPDGLHCCWRLGCLPV